MSLTNIMEREARLAILQCLAGEADYRLRSASIRKYLKEMLLINRSEDWFNAQVAALAELGAVTTARRGPVEVIEITKRGLGHVNGEFPPLEGVERSPPRS